MGFIVYRIKNKVNGKRYFGITKCSINKRWNEHRCKSKNGSSHLSRSIRKYGADNFQIKTIQECETEGEMYEAEINLIAKYKTNNPLFGYNNSTGGEVSSKGKKLSEETKRKISNAQKGKKRKPLSDELKRRLSNIAKGRDMSKAIEASSRLRKGKPSHNRVRVRLLETGEEFESITQASEHFGISKSSIANNLSERSNKTRVGKWEYVHEN
jgi:group I intron endonuclease